MKINSIILNKGFSVENQEKKSVDGFKKVFEGLVKQADNSEKQAEKLTEDFVMGKDVPIHEVMIAAEKAKTNLELLVEIRNRALDTYKELTKMQI